MGTLIDILRFVSQHHSQLTKEESELQEQFKQKKSWLRRCKTNSFQESSFKNRHQVVQWNFASESISNNRNNNERGIYKFPKSPLPDPISKSNDMLTLTEFKLLAGYYITTRELDKRDLCNELLETCREEHSDYKELIVSGSVIHKRGRVLPDTSVARITAHDGFKLQIVGNYDIPRIREHCFVDNCLFSFSDLSQSEEYLSASLPSTGSIDITVDDSSEGSPSSTGCTKLNDPLSKTTVITPLGTLNVSTIDDINGGTNLLDNSHSDLLNDSISTIDSIKHEEDVIFDQNINHPPSKNKISLLDTEGFKEEIYTSLKHRLSQTVNLERKTAWNEQPELVRNHSKTQELVSLPSGMGLRDSLINKRPAADIASLCKIPFSRQSRCRTVPLKRSFDNKLPKHDGRSKSVGDSQLPPSPPNSVIGESWLSDPHSPVSTTTAQVIEGSPVVHIKFFTEFIEKNIIKNVRRVANPTCDKEHSEMINLFEKYHKAPPRESSESRSSYWVQRRMIISAVKRKLESKYPSSRIVLCKKGCQDETQSEHQRQVANIDFGKSIKLADLAKVETAETHRNSLLGFEWGIRRQPKSPPSVPRKSILTLPFNVDHCDPLVAEDDHDDDVFTKQKDMACLTSATRTIIDNDIPVDIVDQRSKSPLSLQVLRKSSPNDLLPTTQSQSLSSSLVLSSSILARKIPVALTAANEEATCTPLGIHNQSRRRNNTLRSKTVRSDSLRCISGLMRSDEFSNLSRRTHSHDSDSLSKSQLTINKSIQQTQQCENVGQHKDSTPRARSCDAPKSTPTTSFYNRPLNDNNKTTKLMTTRIKTEDRSVRTKSRDLQSTRTRDSSSTESVRTIGSPRTRTRDVKTSDKSVRAKSYDSQSTHTREGSSTENVRTIRPNKGNNQITRANSCDPQLLSTRNSLCAASGLSSQRNGSRNRNEGISRLQTQNTRPGSHTAEAKVINSPRILSRHKSNLDQTNTKPHRAKSCEIQSTHTRDTSHTESSKTTKSVNNKRLNNYMRDGSSTDSITTVKELNKRRIVHSSNKNVISDNMKTLRARSLDSEKASATRFVRTNSEGLKTKTRLKPKIVDNGSSTESIKMIKEGRQLTSRGRSTPDVVSKTTKVRNRSTDSRHGSSTESIQPIANNNRIRQLRNRSTGHGSSTETIHPLRTSSQVTTRGRVTPPGVVHNGSTDSRHDSSTDSVQTIKTNSQNNINKQDNNDPELVKQLSERVTALEDVLSVIREESKLQRDTFGQQFAALTALLTDIHKK